MRVLVTGVKGQLGYDVVGELQRRGLEAVGVDIEEMDITDGESVRRVISEAKVDAVIHCAAYTAVDKDTAAKVQKMIDKLEDNDDVQNVYHTAEFPDDFDPEA